MDSFGFGISFFFFSGSGSSLSYSVVTLFAMLVASGSSVERILSISAFISATVSSLSWTYSALKRGSTNELLSIDCDTQADS